MANRSYLYATNIIPGTRPDSVGLKVRGLSEWDYDIPLVYKLLLAGNPRTCPSAIWGDLKGDCALIGDYGQGVERLCQFLQQINHPIAMPLVEEALTFLDNKENKNSYFLLECTEIFCMDEEEPAQQNRALLEKIRHIDSLASQTVQTLQAQLPSPAAPQSFFSRLFGDKPKPTPEEDAFLCSIIELGLGDWNNILYFELGKE